MKGKISLLTRKVFATAIALAMSIPPAAFAKEDQKATYNLDSSIMGLAEESKEAKIEVENTDKTQLIKDLGDYELEISARLSDSLEKIDYTIKARRKQALEEDNDKNLSLTLAKTKSSNINDLRLNQASTDLQEIKQDVEKDLTSLSLTSKAEDEIIYELTADVNKAKDQRSYNLILGLKEEDSKASLLNYDLEVKEEVASIDDEEVKTLELQLQEEYKTKAYGNYKKENFLAGILTSYDSLTWTDYITNDSDENKEFTYDFNLDSNQETDKSKIELDYYELTDQGFKIKTEFSQAIDFAEKINFEIPKDHITKITLKTKVSKKNTEVENYSLNNRELKNPIYIEGNEEENSDDDEDPLPKEETKEESSAKPTKENSEKSEEENTDTKIEIEDASTAEEEKISALSLNKDSLVEKLKAEDKLTADLESFIEDLAQNLNSYNEEKITDQELKDFTKAQATNKKIEKEDLRSYIDSILSGLNKQTNKAANLNIDEIIDYAYPEEKDTEKAEETETEENLTNLEKADKELKEALADEKNGIDEIQALLDSFEEKYKLSRDAQEKLMIDNNDAINALVEKDRNANTRRNNLRASSPTFKGKVFNLNTTMKAVASPKPIPKGWTFDIKLGKYLKKDPNKEINSLTHKGKTIATGEYKEIGDDHFIRYTYIAPLTETVDLQINQDLVFDTSNIQYRDYVDITIQAAPKNNRVQTMDTIRVYKNSDSPVRSSFNVIDQGESDQVTYPYRLSWSTTSQKLKDKNHQEITSRIVPNLDGAYVEWDIKVDTSSLKDSNLDFENLNITVFALNNQGIEELAFDANTNKDALNNGTYSYVRPDGNLLSQSKSISKSQIDNELYLKVKAPIDTGDVHDTYSIGLRINPDQNYVEKMVADFEAKFKSIPTIFKWVRGLEEAKQFANAPFNLVETMIPARIGVRDNFTNERFYYDTTRTIVADRVHDNRADWYALDLIRLGEKLDQGLDNAKFRLNNGNKKLDTNPTKVYYRPLKEGGYERTLYVGDVTLPNGEFMPGTLVAYEYLNQEGTRDDTYYLSADLKEKSINNFSGDGTTGGRVDLYTQKISDKQLSTNYIAYFEKPYPIMRINKNFDMVQCFNYGLKDPASQDGSSGIFLDMHVNPTGKYLLSRVTNPETIKPKLQKIKDPSDPEKTLSEEEAMEDLMKRIYFYGEEVKEQYKIDNNGKQMHRLVENSMYQRVLHHYTDGNDISKDYIPVPDKYNQMEWRVPYTLTGRRVRTDDGSPKFEGSFAGKIRKHESGARLLKENETVIQAEPYVKDVQYEMAEKLLNKVKKSYQNGSTWSKQKANTVELVFYSHTEDGEKYQELLTGRVNKPIEIDKYTDKIDKDKKLAGAVFEIRNIYTNEVFTWTSNENTNPGKLYLGPGTYRIEEKKAPEGYEKIKPFQIEVERKEVNPDDGSYEFKNFDEIHVHDGFETNVEVEADKLPKNIDNEPMVEIDSSKDDYGVTQIKVNVKNNPDNLGELKFAKQNAFYNLDKAEFSLSKIVAKDLNDAKTEFNKQSPAYDDTYSQKSGGFRGNFEFKQIPKGFYILEETKAPKGYKGGAKYLLQAEEEDVVENGQTKKKVVVKFVEGDKIPTKKTSDGRPIIVNELKDTEIKFRKIRKREKRDNSDLGLADATFRLESIWTKDGSTYYKTQTSSSGNDSDKGYFIFDKLVVGEYKLTELQAPYGYQKSDSHWIVEVSDEGEDLKKTIYEVSPNGEKTEKTEITPDSEPYRIKNEPRKVDTSFTKYLGEIEKDEDGSIKKDDDGNPIVNKTEVTKKLYGSDDKPVRFELYEADYYGAIVGDAIDENIIQDDDGLFHLRNLEFGRYYVLRETNPPKVDGVQYEKANDILLKVEAEAIAQEGRMKVVVRDPNTNTVFGSHAVFNGVIDFKEGEQLGKFTIRKTGNAIRYIDKETGELVEIDKNDPKIVGLRRAYFRLYNADSKFNISYKDPDGKYAENYIQKVSPGKPIIGYLTEEQANSLKEKDPEAYKKLGLTGETKEFDNKKGGKTKYPVDSKGNRIRIGKDPSYLPKDQGIVTFDNLTPGYYVLEEFRGPAGYERTTQKWYIKVDDDGRTIRSDKKDDPAFAGNISASSIADLSNSPRLMMAGVNVSDPQRPDLVTSSPRSLILDETTSSYQTEPNVTIEEELEIGDEIIGERVTASGSDVEIGHTYTNETMGRDSGTTKIDVTTTVDQLPNDEFKVTIRTKLLEGSGNNGYYKLSFNNNFEFVLNSTSSDRQPSVNDSRYNGRWHSGYNSSNNEIYIPAREPRLKRDQTAIIEFKVTPRDKESLNTGQAYELINEVEYKPNTGLNTLVHKIQSPTITYKKIQNITYKDEIVLVKELPIPDESIRRENPYMYKGEERTVFAGSEGKVEEKRRYKYIDGVKQENNYYLVETITTEPQAPIVEYGTKESPVTPDPENPDQPSEQGSVNLEVNFTYSNSENGEATPTPGQAQRGPGTIILQDAEGKELEKQTAKYEGRVGFKRKLDPSNDYRLVYNISDEQAKEWTLPNKPVYSITSGDMKDTTEKITINISNGNTLDIFNKDETGFRIPLRITKVNENKGVLTGAQFKARKLINGDKLSDGKYPKYYDEEYDGVSEATGLPGDNYFRELSPGIYELEEIKTPDETYKLPKDKKWYFKVEIAPNKKPSDDDYMKINFEFRYTLPSEVNDEKWNSAISTEERQKLAGTEIRGIDRGKEGFDQYTEIIDDNHRSDPARPDSPYKGINDIRVTNYKKTTELRFLKKDLASREDLEGAVFTLKRAKLNDDGTISFDKQGNPEFEDLEERVESTDSQGNVIEDSNGNHIMIDKFIKPEPYKKSLKGAVDTATKDSGVHFTNIAEGTYILEETKPTTGYKLEDIFLTIKFYSDKNGDWAQEVKAYKLINGVYKEVTTEDKNSIFLTNGDNTELDVVFNKKDKIDFTFKKIEGTSAEKPIDSASFTLKKVDEDGEEDKSFDKQHRYNYDNDEFIFTNLDVGRYELVETRALQGYEKPDPWFFRVVQGDDNKLKIVFEKEYTDLRFTSVESEEQKETPGTESEEDNETSDQESNKDKRTPEMDDKDPDTNPRPNDLRIANYKKTNFKFKKVGNDNQNKGLRDAEFSLTKLRYGMDSKEIDAEKSATKKYDQKARSQNDGSVVFDDLTEGIYQLVETVKPEGYDSSKAQDRWIIQVVKGENGSGLEVKYSSEFEKQYYKKYANHNTNPNKEEDNYYTTYDTNGYGTEGNISLIKQTDDDFAYILTNKKSTTDLKWKKVEAVDEKDNTDNQDIVIESKTKFRLFKTSNATDEDARKNAKNISSIIAPFDIESENGEFVVENLGKGTYVLVETQAPDGYKIMDRRIIIQIKEENDGKLVKEFFEMETDVKKDIITDKDLFTYLYTKDSDKNNDVNFYVKNYPKDGFLLSKGYMPDGGGFTPITEGKLELKFYEEGYEANAYTKVIDLAKDKLREDSNVYKFDVENIDTTKTYILEETGSPDGYTKTTNKYKIKFEKSETGETLIPKLVSIDGVDSNKTDTEDTIDENGIILDNGVPNNGGKVLQIVNEKTEIEFIKVGKDGDKEEKLVGVDFHLEKQEEDTTTYRPVDKEMKFTDKDSVYKEESKGGGKVKFVGLTEGNYRIIEDKALKGYITPKNPVKTFKVRNGEITEIDGKVPNNSDDQKKIINYKAEYPGTGGPGVWIGFAIIGIVLMTVAGFVYNRKRNLE